MTIVIPRRTASATNAKRKPAFVSPATQGIAVRVSHATNGVNDYNVTTDYDVSGDSSTSCTGSNPETCTLDIPAPVTAGGSDVDTFAFTLYDQAPGGTPLSFGTSASVLGTGSTTSPIIVDTANSISAYIDGLPTALQFASAVGLQRVVSGDAYLGFTATVDAQALDAQSDVIAAGAYDPYVPAFVIAIASEQKPTGSTLLSLAPPASGGASPVPAACDPTVSSASSVTTCRSSDVITASYLQPSSATFSTSYYATVTSATSSVKNTVPLYVAPDYVAIASVSGSAAFAAGASGKSPVLALHGGTGTVTLSSPGTLKEGTAPIFNDAQNGNCMGVIDGQIDQMSGTSFEISGVASAEEQDMGGCVVTFTDGFSGTVALDVTDTP